MPIETAKRIERAIQAVDTIIRNHDRVAIHYPIFGHGLISPGYFTPLSRTLWGYRGVQAVKRLRSGCGAPILMQTIDVPSSIKRRAAIGHPAQVHPGNARGRRPGDEGLSATPGNVP